MADNVIANAGAGGATFATDDIAGVHFPRTKLIHGADGVNDGDVSTANPLPVDLRTENLAGNLDVNIAAQAAAINIADGGNVISVDDGAGSLTVDGTVTANLGTIGGAATEATLSTLNGKVPASPSQEHTSAISPHSARLTDGTAFYKATTPSDTQPVSAASLPLPTGAATEATLSSLNGKTINTSDTRQGTHDNLNLNANLQMGDADVGASNPVPVVGNVAHDGVDAGAPIKIGLRTIAHGANPTAIDAADRSNWYANRHGIPFMMGGHPNVISREVTVTAGDGAQTNALFLDISAGMKIVVTQASVMVGNAVSVNVPCRVGFGASAVPTAALAGVDGVVLSHPNIAPGSGVVRGDGSGIVGVGGDGGDLRYTCGVPTGGSLTILVSYFTIES